MLKMNLGRSDAFRASWIFFACPIDRTLMVRAAKNVLVVGFLLPYMLMVGVVLSFYTTNVVHLIVHLLAEIRSAIAAETFRELERDWLGTYLAGRPSGLSGADAQSL